MLTDRQRRELTIDTIASWALEGMRPDQATIDNINAFLDGRLSAEEYIEKSKATTGGERIGKLVAFNTSFAQMPGDNPFPSRLESEPRRSTKIFLHAAHRDLNWNARDHNWFAETLETAAALARSGYDFRLVVGDGGHSPDHGGVLLPDALRWLWSDAAQK